MSFVLSVDYASVLSAAESLASLAGRLAGAPGEQALRSVARSVPEGLLAEAARREADEWQREISEVTQASERYAAGMWAAVEAYRESDERSAR